MARPSYFQLFGASPRRALELLKEAFGKGVAAVDGSDEYIRYVTEEVRITADDKPMDAFAAGRGRRRALLRFRLPR